MDKICWDCTKLRKRGFIEPCTSCALRNIVDDAVSEFRAKFSESYRRALEEAGR